MRNAWYLAATAYNPHIEAGMPAAIRASDDDAPRHLRTTPQFDAAFWTCQVGPTLPSIDAPVTTAPFMNLADVVRGATPQDVGFAVGTVIADAGNLPTRPDIADPGRGIGRRVERAGHEPDADVNRHLQIFPSKARNWSGQARADRHGRVIHGRRIKRADKLRGKGEEVDFKELLLLEPDSGTTNIRNTSSGHWKRWLGLESRCLVPFSSFSEYEDVDGKTVPVVCA